MKYLATAALATVCALGCTAHNPSYTGDGGGGGGGGSPDFAGTSGADLAGVAVDLSGPLGSCAADQRQCSGTVASDRCEGGMFVVDRVCPPASSCMAGYCAPPTAMFGTQIGARCDANGGAQQLQCMASPTAMLSCQPFVDLATKELRWFCDTGVGMGRAGQHCAKPGDCRSGVCVQTAGGVCFDACQRDQDCQLGGGTLTCKSVSITVEGVTKTEKTCG
jgi:hypothetical protein